ncbi:MAG: RHS repeat-associated core domain-containing protein [Tepidisphaerales bacterium]
MTTPRCHSDGPPDPEDGSGAIVMIRSSVFGFGSMSKPMCAPLSHHLHPRFPPTASAEADPTHTFVRYNSDGSVDTSYGFSGPNGTGTAGGGATYTDATDKSDGISSLTRQADGKLVMTSYYGGRLHQFQITRHNADGTYDTSFSSDGKLTVGWSDAIDLYAATVVDGRIVAVGVTSGDFAVAVVEGGERLEERLWATHDANGNITAVTDVMGNVVQRSEYDPYGGRTFLTAGWASTTDAHNFAPGFQGLRQDTITGWWDARNRWLIPGLQTWNRMDPTGAAYVDGANLYEAFLGAPIGTVDPMGLEGTATTGPAPAPAPAPAPPPVVFSSTAPKGSTSLRLRNGTQLLAISWDATRTTAINKRFFIPSSRVFLPSTFVKFGIYTDMGPFLGPPNPKSTILWHQTVGIKLPGDMMPEDVNFIESGETKEHGGRDPLKDVVGDNSQGDPNKPYGPAPYEHNQNGEMDDEPMLSLYTISTTNWLGQKVPGIGAGDLDFTPLYPLQSGWVQKGFVSWPQDGNQPLGVKIIWSTQMNNSFVNGTRFSIRVVGNGN